MSLVKKISLTPRILFLIDGLGAIISALILGVILVRYNELIGMPVNSLYFLALLPLVFIFYDVYCYLTIKNRLLSKVKGIVTLNSLYCIISIIEIYINWKSLTSLGLTYFVLELIVLILIIRFEVSVMKKFS